MPKNSLLFKLSLIFLFLVSILSFISGCGGGGGAVGYLVDENYKGEDNPPISTSKSFQINGTVPSEAIASSPVLHAADIGANSRYQIAVVDKDNIQSEIGTVTVTGSSYTATIDAALAQNKYALIVIREKVSKKIIYSNLLGKMPAYSDIPSSVSLIKISGIAVDESTTAKTLIAIEKNIIPDTPIIGISSSDISNGTIIKDFSSTGTLFNSALESRIGDSALIAEMSKAVKTVATVMTSTAVNPTIKELLSSSQQMSATGMLTTFSNIVKTTENTVSTLVTSMHLPTSVTISNT
ncbi:MAG TPA: hypothetical protein PK467_18680, partial [Candidatus Wallbacteria bacterium]|nr:hypothetical protein [Candidatus Wallbacteria bacterium]